MTANNGIEAQEIESKSDGHGINIQYDADNARTLMVDLAMLDAGDDHVVMSMCQKLPPTPSSQQMNSETQYALLARYGITWMHCRRMATVLAQACDDHDRREAENSAKLQK